ncbi:hypothetical protein BKA62DRAFT_160062 [Auriculariales sp. MPI-PUGE-AT-0066]|nr:hypothetical protein BKA62DRAFT_160062 [Auriculariales sp. MPI-PUGE-AT-0066]
MRTLCDLLATSPTSAGVVGGLGSAMGGQGGPFAAAQHAFAPGQGVPVNVNTPFLIQPTTTPAASNTSLFTGLTGLSINTSGSDELPALAALVLRSLLHRATSLGEQTIDLRGTRARSAAILLSAREVQRERLREIEGRERRERRERRSSKVSVKSVKSINHGGEEKVRKRASFLPARFSRDRERGAVPPSPTVGSSHGHGYGAEEVPPLPVDHREWSKAKERLLANAKSAPDLRTVSSTSSFVDVLKGVFSFKRAGKENRDASATQAHADDGKKKRRPVVRISTANISVARQEHEHLQPPSFPSSPVVAGYPSSPVVGSSKTANTHANTSTSQFGALSPLNSPAASRSATPVAFGGLVPPSGPRVDDDGAGSVRSVGTKRPRLSSMFSSSKDNSGGSMPPSPTTAPATTTSFRHPMNFGEEFSAVDPAVVRNAPKLFVRIEADLGQLDVALADVSWPRWTAGTEIVLTFTVSSLITICTAPSLRSPALRRSLTVSSMRVFKRSLKRISHPQHRQRTYSRRTCRPRGRTSSNKPRMHRQAQLTRLPQASTRYLALDTAARAASAVARPIAVSAPRRPASRAAVCPARLGAR